MIQLTEHVLHQSQCPIHLLTTTSFLRHDCSLSPGYKQILLCFEVSLFRVADEQLCHVVDNHADPFAIHAVKAADALKMLIALLEGLEHLICIAGALPATLLIQVAGML